MSPILSVIVIAILSKVIIIVIVSSNIGLAKTFCSSENTLAYCVIFKGEKRFMGSTIYASKLSL